MHTCMHRASVCTYTLLRLVRKVTYISSQKPEKKKDHQTVLSLDYTLTRSSSRDGSLSLILKPLSNYLCAHYSYLTYWFLATVSVPWLQYLFQPHTAGETMEKETCTAGGNINCSNQYGNKYEWIFPQKCKNKTFIWPTSSLLRLSLSQHNTEILAHLGFTKTAKLWNQHSCLQQMTG